LSNRNPWCLGAHQLLQIHGPFHVAVCFIRLESVSWTSSAGMTASLCSSCNRSTSLISPTACERGRAPSWIRTNAGVYDGQYASEAVGGTESARFCPPSTGLLQPRDLLRAAGKSSAFQSGVNHRVNSRDPGCETKQSSVRRRTPFDPAKLSILLGDIAGHAPCRVPAADHKGSFRSRVILTGQDFCGTLVAPSRAFAKVRLKYYRHRGE